MNADVTSSARIIEIFYETNRAVVRFEGRPHAIGVDVLLAPRQCGWVDEFGNVFPMNAWKPLKRTWQDADKANWAPLYRAGTVSG